MATQDIDLGYKEFLKQLRILENNPFVKIGVMGEKKYKPDPDTGKSSDPPTMVDIATFNEFGAPSRNIPARPAIRNAHDVNMSKNLALRNRLFEGILAGQSTVKKALGIIGITVQSQQQKSITDLRTPGNSPKTTKRKKSTNPLVDTGQYRQSISYEINLKGSI